MSTDREERFGKNAFTDAPSPKINGEREFFSEGTQHEKANLS